MNGELIKIILTTVLGSILGSGAVFGFIQFLIQRKDNKEEKTFDKKIEIVEKKLKEGLDDREETGRKRYEEHKEAIEELRKAIMALTENANERKDFESYIGASLMAITHDKLIYLGKKYQERKYITLSEKNNLKLLFEPYHNGLHGNSDGETYYNYCMNLPVISDEDAQKMDKDILKTKMTF